MYNNDVIDTYTQQLYERVAFVTIDNVLVNAYDYIKSEQADIPLNDLLVTYAHGCVGRAGNVPADTGKATLILEYVNGRCVYKRANGEVIGSSMLDDDGEEWTVTFKNAAKQATHIEANEYDSFVRQFT